MSNTTKKIIVPVVALLLCAVAVIGVAFAYVTTSVENTENTVETNKISLNFKGDTASGAFNVDDVFIDYGTYITDGKVTKYVVPANHAGGLELKQRTLALTSEKTVKDARTFVLSVSITKEDAQDININDADLKVKYNNRIYSVDEFNAEKIEMTIAAGTDSVEFNVTLVAFWSETTLNAPAQGEPAEPAKPYFGSYTVTFTAAEPVPAGA